MFSTLLSIGIGAIAGITYYGLSFVAQQRKGHFSCETPTIPRTLIAFSVARVLLASYIFYLILRLPDINPILIVITFIGVFWAIILGRDLNLWNRSTTS